MFKFRSLALRCGLALMAGLVAGQAAAAAQGTGLLRQPDITAAQLVFVYGGDLWLSDRNGQNPRQLTSHPAAEFAPKFSPDGKWIAFSASYDNNTDVYVMPVTGGAAKRLTWHPGTDTVNGWSADGKKVLFASNREIANSRSNQLFEVAVSGGYEQKVMQAVAFEGRWSSDGSKLAYRPNNQAYSGTSGWRLHRGGSTPPVWILDVKNQQLEKIPHPNANDTSPFWLNNEVYFLSDRDNTAVNLFKYHNKEVTQLTKNTDWDLRSAAGFGDTVVYEAGGYLYQFNAETGQSQQVAIELQTMSAQKRPQWKDASNTLTSAQLSATGKRVVVSARGEIFTVPLKDGTVRNLSQSSGVREFDGIWSADGQQLAYISDQGNQHQLVITAQDGQSKTGSAKSTTYPLGKTGYFNLLAWSPDGQKLVYQDNHLNLYSFDLKTKKQQKIATSKRRDQFQLSFSADSRYLAYTLAEANYFSQLYLHDFNAGKSSRITDGLSHASDPAFGDGYLYFTASVNTGPSQVGLDLSTQERPLRYGIYAAVLSATGKSPLLTETGDESVAGKKDDEKAGDDKDKADGKDDKKAVVKPVQIDVAGLQHRIVPLPLPEKNYGQLKVAADGALWFLERTQPGASNEGPAADEANNAQLHRFDFKERKAAMIKDGLADYKFSADGKKLLTMAAPASLSHGAAEAKTELKAIDLSGLKTYVDPAQEWQQIFNDAWRMQRDYFYDANLHGIDWQAVYDKYQPLLKFVQRREDLNEVLVEMIAELQVGHNRIGGGDVHQETPSKVGLLGADFVIRDGKYQLKTVLAGDRWNPFLKAPLATPGNSAKAGDFVLAINGEPLDASQNIYQLLDNTQGKQLQLTIADNAAGTNSRQIRVEPIANENELRLWHWVENNRQQVEKASNGKIAYVFLPNTGGGGFYFFNRMFFAQVDKQALIIDERKNGGGQAANYITDILSRPFLSGWKDRDGMIFTTPGGAIYGPKTMLIDQDAGSGGDFLPWAFKRLQLGKTIGTRTWGGLIGISANPNMIDGGFHVVPFFRFYTPDGEWRVENEGVAPDIELELDPIAVNQGRDVQLERAIAETLQQLQSKPVQVPNQAPSMPVELGK
ncbi:peptidase S41 [Rheinheimera sp. SA_1]|uniref:S41 family peptidase n=1 Tax=Rheinheimera sp. SA_1 TaxID=1827365 RepID=UPI0007FE7B4B|nr:S41 family peptidase [Rheinheimera sp. SA_1]OBP16344.1 peptidase S41 [Rheinheimera sp. SA_1]